MRCLLLIGMLLTSSLTLRAQELSAADSAEVQHKALRHVRQFEGLLNLVAQPDRYFRKYSFDRLIRSFYDEQSEYRIFRDSLVAVEDDLNPKAHPDANNFLSIKDYLRGFFSFYEKAPVASVFFSNYQVSPVKKGEFTYVEVFYLSEFTNRHRAYPDQPYPVRHNKATLRAQRQEEGWQVVISNINYYPAQDSVASLAETASAYPELTYQSTLLDLPSAQDTQNSLSGSSDGEMPLENISDALTDSSSTLQILERLDRGTDYQLRRYEEAVASVKSAEQLPLVSSPVATDVSSPAQKSDAEIFKRFAPSIENVGPSSVRVAFNNLASSSLMVELINADQKVLFSEQVASKQSYDATFDLKNFEEDAYRVRVSNRNYEHIVRVYSPLASTDGTTRKDSAALTDFSPYILKIEDQPFIKVVFKNPSADPLKVELVDMDERVLYTEEVPSQQTYAQAISLVKLDRGAYQVRVSHDEDYQHTVRVYYR